GSFLSTDMCKSDRERIGCVVVRGYSQTEKRPHHESDLILSRAAPTDRRLFDSRRRIFKNRQTVFGGGENRRAARRAEQNRGLVALDVNDRFERATIRLVFANQFNQAIADRDQARRRAEFLPVVDR